MIDLCLLKRRINCVIKIYLFPIQFIHAFTRMYRPMGLSGLVKNSMLADLSYIRDDSLIVPWLITIACIL